MNTETSEQLAALNTQLESLCDPETLTELSAIAQAELIAEDAQWFYNLENYARDFEVAERVKGKLNGN